VNTPHQRPFKRLHSLGVIAPFTIAAHMVHVTPEEIAMTVEAGMSVSHNPGSNMKLASGMAPIHDMIQSGINVALGTDGAASNNKLDMFSEMRLASLLAKNREQDPTVIPAPLALQMATLNGARALGREHDLGSLTTGKWADVVAVNMHHIGTALVADPIAELVYAADRSQVDHVWVAGEKLLTHGVPEKVNQSILLAQASLWRSNLYPDLINNHHRNEKQKQ
jgi:5-methylthioadenosine/S-adenosylhomocysteine deaminase